MMRMRRADPSRAPFKASDPPLPRQDPAWRFCHLRGTATIEGRTIRGTVLEENETAGQCRFFEVPIRKVPNADGSLTHALSWVIPRATFTPNGE